MGWNQYARGKTKNREESIKYTVYVFCFIKMLLFNYTSLYIYIFFLILVLNVNIVKNGINDFELDTKSLYLYDLN